MIRNFLAALALAAAAMLIGWLAGDVLFWRQAHAADWRPARATIHSGDELYRGRERAYIGRVVRVVWTPSGSAVIVRRGRCEVQLLRREVASGDYWIRGH